MVSWNVTAWRASHRGSATAHAMSPACSRPMSAQVHSRWPAFTAGQREWTCADIGLEHAGDMACAVAEPRCEALHAVTFHDTIADHLHRTADGIGSDIPFGRTRACVRPASAACPVAGILGGGRGAIERDILRLRRDGRAGRSAVDSGGAHGGEEDAIEAGVARLHRAIAPFVVVDHASIMPARARVF